MAVSQPVATDKLNSPSHSLMHRQIATDPSASAKSVVIDSNDRLGIGIETPETSLHNAGGVSLNVTTVNSATYDLLVTDTILHVTYTGTGAVTSLTLPTAQTTNGRFIRVKDAGGSASINNITIDTEGSETIDGEDTFEISTDYQDVALYSDGSNWYLIAQ
jgi:hypothetical protein